MQMPMKVSPTKPNPPRGGGGKPWVSPAGFGRSPGCRKEKVMGFRPSRRAVAPAVLLLLVYSSIQFAAEPPPFSRRNPITGAVQKTKAAIVTVKVPRPGGGKDLVGTGVVIDERGIIVTNRHVVGACKDPKVRLHDGTTLTAEVVFTEARCDLAALRIHAEEKLPALSLADSDDLLV